MVKVVATLYGRDEAENLPLIIGALKSQTFPLEKIIYVDDASVDGSPEVAEKFGAEVVRLTRRHPSYVGLPQLSLIANKCIEAVYEIPNVDYFVIVGSDTVLPKNYVETLVDRLERDPKLVICSGKVRGEYTRSSAPRGTGRFYRFSFWDKYVKRFPFRYSWESYPIYKAQALGFRVMMFSDVEMITIRPTVEYKSTYGYAMRELGYPAAYALARCLVAFLRQPKVGLRMFYTYITSPYRPFDREVVAFLRRYLTRRMLKALEDLGSLIC
jgi:glycosyltransferase involved in cell wall biosynthesis